LGATVFLAALLAPATAAHAGLVTPPEVILTSAGRPGEMLCVVPTLSGLDDTAMRHLTRTIDPDCRWQMWDSGNDAWNLYSPATNSYLNINGLTSLFPLSTLPADWPQHTQWSLSDQTGDGGVAIRPTSDTDLNINPDPAGDGSKPPSVTSWYWDQHPQMSWQITVFDPNASAPAATPTPAPFPVGSHDELMLDRSGLTPGVANALCASPYDGNVHMESLSPTLDPYCVWEHGGPSGAPTNTYLYNPAKGMVLDLNWGGPLTDPTPIGMQPYYTNPLQTYEWWNAGHIDNAYVAMRPADDTDLNINANLWNAAPSVTGWSTGSNQSQMAWVFVPVS
jgi:hypothetical protein